MATLQTIMKGLDTKKKTYTVNADGGDRSLTRLAFRAQDHLDLSYLV